MEWAPTFVLPATALVPLVLPEPNMTAYHASPIALFIYLMITAVIACLATLTTHTSQVGPNTARLVTPHVRLALRVPPPIAIAVSVMIFSTHLTTTAEHAHLLRLTSLVVPIASHVNLLVPHAQLELSLIV